MRTTMKLLVATALVSFLAGAAHAHIGAASPGFANTTQRITFSVGHGCDGMDTYRLRIQIPAGVTAVKAINSEFGKATVEKTGTVVTAVTWTKAEADLLPSDANHHEVALRALLPNTPFKTIYFPTTQTCRAPGGGETKVVEWVGMGSHNHEADAGPATTDAAAPEPAPSLNLLPARSPGWNKFVVSEHAHDLPVFFSDALIVWSGNAAYSPNPNTKAQIKMEPGVTELTEIHPGTEIWVKY